LKNPNGFLNVYNYSLCGLWAKSEWVFPELAQWDGPTSGSADIIFQSGPVRPFDSPDYEANWLTTKGSDLIINHQHVGRFLIQGGAKVTVEPSEGANQERVRLNLIGSLQAILWHQRGDLPLHASAVQLDANALLFAGPSRSGKSVMAASLVADGFTLLADEFSVISAAPNLAELRPGYPCLRLWKDACDSLGVSDQMVGLAHPAGNKYILAQSSQTLQTSFRVSDVIVLNDNRSDYSLKRLTGAAALANILNVVHVPECVKALGLYSQSIAIAAALLDGGARVWSLTTPDDLTQVRPVTQRCIAALKKQGDLA
jgi:hypothetical protein